MKFKVHNLIQTDKGWECDLDYWEGCICSKNTARILVEQERKPYLKDIVEVWKINHSALHNSQTP